MAFMKEPCATYRQYLKKPPNGAGTLSPHTIIIDHGCFVEGLIASFLHWETKQCWTYCVFHLLKQQRKSNGTQPALESLFDLNF